MSADDEEPYSPGSTSSSGSGTTPSGPSLHSNTLRNKMEELNRQIEEQKQQIRKMAQADSSIGEVIKKFYYCMLPDNTILTQ